VITELAEAVCVQSKLLLNTSETLGAKKEAKFDIYPLTSLRASEKAQQPPDRLAVCEVTSIENGYAECVLTEISPGKDKHIVEGCPAIAQDTAGEMFVRLKRATGSAAQKEYEAIQQAWASSTLKYAKLVLDSWPKPTDLQIVVDEKKLEFQILDEKGHVVSAIFYPDDETAPVTVVNRAMHLARFYSTRKMNTSPQTKRLTQFQVLGRIEPGGEPHTRRPDTYPIIEQYRKSYINPWDGGEVGPVTFHPGEILALAVDNLVNETLYVSMVCLDTFNWSIMAVHPNNAKGRLVGPVPLQSESRLLVPIQQISPKGAAARIEAHDEIIKVFATTSPVDFGVLMLDPMGEAGRGDSKEGTEEDFWGIFGGVMDQDRRIFVTEGDVRPTVQFGIEDLVFNVLPATEDRDTIGDTSLDWNSFD
jgi:hypothetical protein